MTSLGPLEFRAAAEPDQDALDRFQWTCFDRPLDRARWRWLAACPDGPLRLSLAVDAAAEVIATYGLLPLRLWRGGTLAPAALAIQAAVHPAARRQGLFVALGRYALLRSEAPVALGKPNQSALPGHRQVGFRELCPLPVLSRRLARPAAHTCREVDGFDERLDALMARLAPRYSFLVWKDARWWRWRLAAPGRRYRCLVAEGGGRLRGFAVLKDYQGPRGAVTHLLDLQAEDEAALADLVQAAAGIAVGELNLWSNPQDPRREWLTALGFEPRPGRDCLIGRVPEASIELGPLGACFCYADNDVH